MHHLGNYDLCLSIESINLDDELFSGQFCLVSVQTIYFNEIKKQNFYKRSNISSIKSRSDVEFNYGNVLGVCLPDSCDIQQLVNIVNKGNY